MPKASSLYYAGPATKTVRRDGTVTHVRYGKAVAEEICRRIAMGEIWFKICNTGRLPSYTTLYDWLRKHPDFAEGYAQAREMAADLRADKALVVAEESTAATVQSDRLRVGALQWRAAKGAPKRYGSKAGESDRHDAAPPREIVIRVRQFERLIGEDGLAYVREIPLPPEDEA
ncbi:hypothetical protein [Phenylobacterium sp.]|uniref:terminase small subunit-like protein n=1 Tax=Phenylobacterium sp. TaxID=1871053 RepID=UPI00286C415F|nr:hypothetical protein [Phenylobacterium sp.]